MNSPSSPTRSKRLSRLPAALFFRSPEKPAKTRRFLELTEQLFTTLSVLQKQRQQIEEVSRLLQESISQPPQQAVSSPPLTEISTSKNDSSPPVTPSTAP